MDDKREMFDLMRMLSQLKDDELEAVLAAERLYRALHKLDPARVKKPILGPLLDSYLGMYLDRLEGLGIRIRFKV